MKVRGEARWTYEELMSIYEKRKSRSRTFVNGTIAVRLEILVRGDGRRLNIPKTKIYPRGDNLVARYYDTDIVTFRPDGYVEINLHGFATNTTFDRINTLAGVPISKSGQSCISSNKLRVHTTEVREGKAKYWFKRSAPFIEGMRVHLASREIHPDDVAKMPSDVRESYMSPSKAASKTFKPIWNTLKERIMFEVGLSNWADQVVAGNRPAPVSPKNITINLDTLSGDEILGGLFWCMGKRHWWRPDVETVNRAIVTALPNFRRNLLVAYALETDQMDTKGGQLLRNGWYVKEGE